MFIVVQFLNLRQCSGYVNLFKVQCIRRMCLALQHYFQ